MPSWKGKERQMEPRDDAVEGDGGADGIVLPLDVVGSGIYDVAYTIPVKFGDTQQFSLQIDTGSSDLWVASTSCSTSSCDLTNGRLYDPSGSRPTGQDFTIPYLEGSASGPIVWDKVTLGGYSIDNQALAAVNDVEQEPLAPDFSGILGLALPLNSIIAQDIPPVTNNDPDGAAWASNLFSITPVSDAPAARFLSLSLARPGSDAVPSLFGIGRHPSALVPDPSKVQYSTLVSERSGTLFWKASVRAITVYVNSVPKPIALGRSASGAAFPTAVLDSGVPVIFTTSAVANAIYGALGVTPGSDGNYYVPCNTPLNLTFTLDDRPETPIHPLDLTAEPSDSNQAQFCIGLIQPADSVLTSPTSAIGDMILGVPFLRNTYTVMAYTPPNSDGSFPPLSSSSTTTTSGDDSGVAGDDDQPPSRVATKITPLLGLLPLTDPTRALQEFNTVRILNQPLSSSTPAPNTGSGSNTQTVNVGGKKLSVGIVILIGLLSFFALCCALFLVRWLLFRRRFRQRGKGGFGGSDEAVDQKTAYRLARRSSRGALGAVPLVGTGGVGVGGKTLTEDELRALRYRSYVRKSSGKGLSESTVGSDRTLAVEGDEAGEFGYVKRVKSRGEEEEGAEEEEEEDADAVAWGNDTLVAPRHSTATEPHHGADDAAAHAEVRPLVDGASPPSSPDQPAFPHARTYSDPPELALPAAAGQQQHARTPSVQQPLLGPGARSRTQSSGYLDAVVQSHARLFSVDAGADPSLLLPVPEGAAAGVRLVLPPPARQDSNVLDLAEFGGAPVVVATHARLFSVDSSTEGGAMIMPMAAAPPARQDSNVLEMAEFGAPARRFLSLRTDEGEGEGEGEDVHTSMAGIGSAARGSRWLGRGLSIDSLPFNRESLMSVSSVGTVVGPGVPRSPSEMGSS